MQWKIFCFPKGGKKKKTPHHSGNASVPTCNQLHSSAIVCWRSSLCGANRFVTAPRFFSMHVSALPPRRGRCPRCVPVPAQWQKPRSVSRASSSTADSRAGIRSDGSKHARTGAGILHRLPASERRDSVAWRRRREEEVELITVTTTVPTWEFCCFGLFCFFTRLVQL